MAIRVLITTLVDRWGEQPGRPIVTQEINKGGDKRI